MKKEEKKMRFKPIEREKQIVVNEDLEIKFEFFI
jgi:hypothetical protein